MLSLPPGSLAQYSPILVLIDQIEGRTAADELVLFDQDKSATPDKDEESGDKFIYQCVLCE